MIGRKKQVTVEITEQMVEKALQEAGSGGWCNSIEQCCVLHQALRPILNNTFQVGYKFVCMKKGGYFPHNAKNLVGASTDKWPQFIGEKFTIDIPEQFLLN
jgi:hypothetical protein